MDSLTLCLTLLAAVLSLCAWQAWRLRNDQRDVWLIGASSGATGLGAALAHWL
jgi:uncharacterized membrane protein YadS